MRGRPFWCVAVRNASDVGVSGCVVLLRAAPDSSFPRGLELRHLEAHMDQEMISVVYFKLELLTTRADPTD